MNKRIKKKHLRDNEIIRFEATQDIIQEVVNLIAFTQPVEDKKMFPVGPIRYRGYLKKRGFNKRHTQLGSGITKYVKF